MLWYELNGYKGEELKGSTRLKFLYGHLIESLLVVLAEAAGHTVERLQERVEVDSVRGKIDLVLDGILVDVKSCSSRSFEKFKNGRLFEDDPFGYVAQLSGYKSIIKLPAAFLAIDKTTGDICVLRLPDELTTDVPGRIRTVREAVSRSTPPERCYEDVAEGKSGNRKLSTGCSYCAFKIECWKDSNNGSGLRLFNYSGGPRWFTTVVREPDVYEIKQREEFPSK